MKASADGDRTRPPSRRRRLLVAMWLVVLVVYVLDQVTKAVAVAQLTGRAPVPVVDGLLQLRLLYNPGAAFSMATGATWVLTIVAAVVVVAVVRVSRRLGSAGWAAAFGLLLGGAIGNLTDRLVREPGFARGHVVDFIELPSFPVFNVADSAITCAAVTIMALALRGTPVEGRPTADSAAASTDERAGG